jgi:hypothetical protein
MDNIGIQNISFLNNLENKRNTNLPQRNVLLSWTDITQISKFTVGVLFTVL